MVDAVLSVPPTREDADGVRPGVAGRRGVAVTVVIRPDGGSTVVRLSGEVDTYTVPEIREAFDSLMLPGGAHVVVDLSEVTFLDSSGLGAIFSLHHRLGAVAGRLRLVCSGVTLRLVELLHIDQVIEVFTGFEPALETDPE